MNERVVRSFRAAVNRASIRKDTLYGGERVVVPLVALVEGVLHASNSAAPELALASEFGRVPQAWNGRPVMLDHPEIRGEKTSANQPRVLERLRLGDVFNARLEDDKLLMEAWLDPQRVGVVGEGAEELLADLNAGRELTEVSVGVYVETEQKQGEYNGKNYAAIWRNIVPDHLALLPRGTTGACSADMGCGAPRTASEEKDMKPELRTAGSVPKNVSTELADRGTAWSAPSLSDFTSENWADLSAAERTRIAGHYAWSAASPPETFGDLKLPHHRASDGAVVFRGCSAAMGRLDQSDIPAADAGKVRVHLQSHMDAFEAQQKAASSGSLLDRFLALFTKFRSAEDVQEGVSDNELRLKLEQALFAVEPGFLGIAEVYPEAKQVIYGKAPEGEPKLYRRGYELAEDGAVKLSDTTEEVQQKTVYEAASRIRPAATGLSDNDVRQLVQNALLQAEGNPEWLWVEAVFDAAVVYSMRSAGVGEQYFERDYQIANGVVTLGSERRSVKRVVSYLAASGKRILTYETAASCGCGPEQKKAAGERDSDVTKKERLTAIIASGKTCFTEADIPVLEQFSDERLTVMEEFVKKNTAPPPEVKTEPLTEEKVLTAFPDLKKIVDGHRAAEAARKTTLINKLKTAAKASYTEEELTAMPVEQLEKLDRLITTTSAKPDFTPMAARAAEGDDVPPKPIDMAERIRALGQKKSA